MLLEWPTETFVEAEVRLFSSSDLIGGISVFCLSTLVVSSEKGII